MKRALIINAVSVIITSVLLLGIFNLKSLDFISSIIPGWNTTINTTTDYVLIIGIIVLLVFVIFFAIKFILSKVLG
jgi:hypothetical protein